MERKIAQREALANSVVVESIPEITGHFEIINHDRKGIQIADDKFSLVGKGQIVAPVGVEIEKDAELLAAGAIWVRRCGNRDCINANSPLSEAGDVQSEKISD